MPLTFEEINALGNVLDSTWGKSSTTKDSMHSVKASLVSEDLLRVTYTTVVTFNSALASHVALQRFDEDAKKVVRSYLSDVRSEYKKISGKSIKLVVESSTCDIEHLNMSPHNPKKMAYYRQVNIIKVS